MAKHSEHEFLVLVADDSEHDRLLLNAAIQRASRLRLVAEVANGTDAIAYFQGLAEFADRKKFPLPHLLLLDLSMPVKDGFEVLKWLKHHPRSNLKVVVLTDSVHPEHIKRALDLGADHFQVKPTYRADMETMVLALEESLLQSVQPSPRHAFSPAFAPTA